MTDVWLTVAVPAAVGAGTTWYTAGGRAALARRGIREDLETARLLPRGETRRALEKMADDKAIRYAARWVGTAPLTFRQHAFLAGSTAVGGLLIWISSQFAPNLHHPHLASWILVPALIWGLALLTFGPVYWISAVVTTNKAKDREITLRNQRERVHLYGSSKPES